jgi:precorrin-2 methylase
MTKFSSAITLMRSCTNSAFVNGVSSGSPCCADAGAKVSSGSTLGVIVVNIPTMEAADLRRSFQARAS